MSKSCPTSWIAFAQSQRIASGRPRDVAASVKAFVGGDPSTPVLVFNSVTSHIVELDLRGSLDDVIGRLPQQPQSGGPQAANAQPAQRARKTPGRPKLGVTAREVTLMPRHWDWLASQPGGASVTLRKLVEQALRAGKGRDEARRAKNAAYEFISAMAGDEPGFEEASRALFADDYDTFTEFVAQWPVDVREHALALVASANDAQKALPSALES